MKAKEKLQLNISKFKNKFNSTMQYYFFSFIVIIYSILGN